MITELQEWDLHCQVTDQVAIWYNAAGNVGKVCPERKEVLALCL